MCSNKSEISQQVHSNSIKVLVIRYAKKLLQYTLKIKTDPVDISGILYYCKYQIHKFILS